MKHFKFDSELTLKPDIKKINNEKKGDNSVFTLAKYSSVGYYLITPIFIGVIFGWIADKYFFTESKGILIGITIGTFSSFFNLYKLTREL